MNTISMIAVQKMVLIVDDDPLMTELFGEILAEQYEVKIANSIVQAQQIIERENICVVISDYHFDQQDANELFSWLLQINPSLAAKFILLTGDKVADLRGFESMATVLYKPVEIEKLLETVAELFQVEKEMS